MDGGQKSVLLKSQNNFNIYDNPKGAISASSCKYIIGFERNIRSILGKLYSNGNAKNKRVIGMGVRNESPSFFHRHTKYKNQSYTTGAETPLSKECNSSFRKIDNKVNDYGHSKSTDKLCINTSQSKSFVNQHIIAAFPNFPTIKRNRTHLKAKHDLLKRHLRRLSSNDRCFSNLRSQICNSVAIKSIPVPAQNHYQTRKKVVLLIPLLKNHIE